MAGGSLKVLVVDDEERLRSNTVRLLCSHGLDVRGAGDGPQALGMLSGFKADVVVLDLGLPGWSGAETLARLRAAGCDAEVVVLTGHASVDMATDMLDLGASEYLLKPCPLAELLGTIQRLTDRRRAVGPNGA